MSKFWKFLFDSGRDLNNYFVENNKVKRRKAWINKFKDTDEMVHEIAPGLKLRLNKDSILSQAIYQGFEKEETEFVSKFLRPNDVFFDIGANIGLFSLLASRAIGPNGKVYAFEPTQKTFGRLNDNISLNGITNISTFDFAFSDKPGKLKLNTSDNGYDAWNSFALIRPEYYNKECIVDVKTIDDVVQEMKITNINFIKLDVEGWEKFVLLGGEKTIKNSNDMVLLVEFTAENAFASGYYVHEIYDLLVTWGYKWFSYAEGKLIDEPKQLDYRYTNFIAVKDKNTILNRLN